MDIIWNYFTIYNHHQKEIEKYKKIEIDRRRNELILYYKYGYIV